MLSGESAGGVSVHTGTIPSKTLRETVLNLTGWRERGFYGRAYRVKKDIGAKDLMMRLHMTLDHEVDVPAATRAAVGSGVWLRPFRDLIYTMPPYVADRPSPPYCFGQAIPAQPCSKSLRCQSRSNCAAAGPLAGRGAPGTLLLSQERAFARNSRSASE